MPLLGLILLYTSLIPWKNHSLVYQKNTREGCSFSPCRVLVPSRPFPSWPGPWSTLVLDGKSWAGSGRGIWWQLGSSPHPHLAMASCPTTLPPLPWCSFCSAGTSAVGWSVIPVGEASWLKRLIVFVEQTMSGVCFLNLVATANCKQTASSSAKVQSTMFVNAYISIIIVVIVIPQDL